MNSFIEQTGAGAGHNAGTSGAGINLTRVSTNFRPHPLVRAPVMQTVLSSINQSRPVDVVTRAEQPILFDAGPDQTGADMTQPVRLLGYYNRALTPVRKGLVLLLHGWEGCSHSNYNLLTSTALVHAGYDVVRLNFRDHGPGIHVDPFQLNKGVFLGTLIDEVVEAAHQIAAMAGELPLYIVGASLGGNFALRLARSHTTRPIRNLQRVVVFSPAINPDRATRAIDEKAAYKLYFRRRWSNSLRRKQAAFPDLYDFSAALKNPSIYAMTDIMARQGGVHESAAAYFAEYAVMGHALADLNIPTTIVTALDDAVIPVVDFYTLTPHPLLDIRIERFGGHVGWVDIFPFQHRLPGMLLAILDEEPVE